jgi:hypothetical protein
MSTPTFYTATATSLENNTSPFSNPVQGR